MFFSMIGLVRKTDYDTKITKIGNRKPNILDLIEN